MAYRIKNIIKHSDIHSTSRILFTPRSKIDNAYIEEYVDIPSFDGHLKSLSIGRCTYVSGKMKIYGFNGKLKIGRYCSIAGELLLICGDGFHKMMRLSTYPFPFRPPFNGKGIEKILYEDTSHFPKTELIIGNDVWIGEDVLIVKNVKIGDGALIAAKSVVNEDVPPFALVAGNPAKVKKYRHSSEVIQMIEKVKWWEWSIDKVEKNISKFKLTGDELAKELERMLNRVGNCS